MCVLEALEDRDKERCRCKDCNRAKKRLADAVSRLPAQAKEDWNRMTTTEQKKTFRNDNKGTLASDLPTKMEAFVKEALLRLRFDF